MTKTLDNLLEGCMLIGFDWTYLYVNEAAARHGLQDRDKLLGRAMLEMYPGVEQSDVFRHYRLAMEDRIPQHFETSFTFADGTVNWYELAVEPVPEGVFILSLDITQRKQSEEALETAREFAENLIEAMLDGFSVLDKDGRSVNPNPALCLMTGFSRGEPIDRYPPFPYWPPEEDEPIRAAFEKTMKGEVGHFELTYMRKNGERFPVVVSPSVMRDQHGNILNYIATVKDMSREHEALDALERSESWLRSIYENTNTGIASTDSSGRVSGFNEAFRSM
ncbi:hypothetical protein BJI67_03180 [Acidihalobacter aeolianus]|uniref:histidine kinase n=1 Tax=Acidihalobacter aeolianus TaxID=2792603 RepID=A0A1D8K5H9_9GAMM|nr:hypothetical protein BJI67_03180 [Acidihalobacter aeolianus]